jgi:solute:Na+ symporter, SSS family
MALVIRLLLGWPIPISIVLAAAIVLVYITLGGLSSAIYNEVLQFFVILAGLVRSPSSGSRPSAAGAGSRTR